MSRHLGPCLALVLVLLSLSVAPAAPAAAAPASAATDRSASESGLATLQWLAATAGSVLSGAIAAQAEGQGTAIGVLALSPALIGLTVCAIGNASAHNDGRCGASIGGAYVGALTLVPLVYLASWDTHTDQGGQAHGNGMAALVGAAVAWIVIQPITSTGAWHLFKTPKGASTPRARGPTFLSTSERAPRTRFSLAPGQLTWPLLAREF